ncbi:MAG TPA: amidohydrolase family protein [Thermoanaerobaculia bacterium]|jgi:imidazolonepropionase-like amidohydrolase
MLSMLLATTISIKAARVIDGRGHMTPNAAVVIEGNKIIRIDPHPAHADYDLGDRTLMPGGVDTHVHIHWHFGPDGKSHPDNSDHSEPQEVYALYAYENAWATLQGGITTVQSLGSPIDKTVRDAIARGVLPGPRILTAYEPIADNKLTPDEMRAAVDKLAADGADVVKVFASQSIRTGGGPTMSQEQMNAICDEAKKHNLRVVVHAHGPESVRRAVLAGASSIEHGVLIGQPELDLMAEHGTYFDPQLDLIFRNYFENKAHYLGTPGYTEEGFTAMHAAGPKALNVFQLGLKTPKLKIVFGTDAVAGAHGRNFQELEYRVRTGGQSAMDAITSATSLSAESLRLGDTIGTLAPGYEADLIAVDGNPLTDIGALEHVSFVMRGGKVYKNVE